MTPWHRSIPVRYAAISLVAALFPLLVVGGSYDRYATNLLDTLTGERLDRRLTAISGRLAGFLDVRLSQLDTLAHHPDLVSLLGQSRPVQDQPAVRTVVEFEADQPDLYGILLFANDGALLGAIPSQAAAGPPYWGAGELSIAGLPRAKLDEVDVIGPLPPQDGRPGSLLLMQDVPGPFPESAPVGRVALHVRLASLTELMGADEATDLFHAILLPPDGKAYSNVGMPEAPPGDLHVGPEILPGWRPALVVDAQHLAEPLQSVRNVLFTMTIVVAGVLIWLFLSLSRRVTHRIRGLVDGAEAIASGQLSSRIEARGKDEVSVVARAFNAMAERLQQVIQSNVEVEKMAVLGRFATGVAHEVRNPLATMKTTVQALLATEAVDERRTILAGMDEEIDRLDDTLGDLLTYARPRQPHLVDIPVRQILHRVCTVAEPQLKEAGVRTVTLGGPDLVVSADQGHLQQIMMNLILNATQAMPHGGVLTIRGLREGAVGLIEVSDTGAGMSPEVLAHVLEPFFTTRKEGTGLGLSISRQLAELNGGSLQVTSEAGHGTTVTLRLPIAAGGGA